MKHSDGPWIVELDNNHTDIVNNNYTIAFDVQPQDAMLIAKAPDLLFTAKNLLRSLPITGLSLAAEKDIQSLQLVIDFIEGRRK